MSHSDLKLNTNTIVTSILHMLKLRKCIKKYFKDQKIYSPKNEEKIPMM